MRPGRALPPIIGLAAGAYAWALAGALPDDSYWRAGAAAFTGCGVGLIAVRLRARADRLSLRIGRAARTDPLTGLPNRRALEERLAAALKRAAGSGETFALIVADVDGFRHLNDRVGNEAADGALRLLARDFGKWKRRVDVAARVGGEEFALLLPETDERGALIVADRLRRATRRTFADVPVALTLSFGIATASAETEAPDRLFARCDRALLAAKELGGDRAVLYSSELDRSLAQVAGSDGRQLQEASAIGLAEALDIRDTGSATHCRTVGRYAELAALELGLGRERADRVRLAGVLHDIGMIGVAEEVASKPGPLDDDEREEVNRHPGLAARLLAGPHLDDLCGWIEAHHERPDGAGYPLGLGGDEIPLEARILAVADAYEAMSSDRPYRPALGAQGARVELTAGSGTQFDAQVVQAFLRALDRTAVLAQGASSGT